MPAPVAPASSAADVIRAANRCLDRLRRIGLGLYLPAVHPEALDEADRTLTAAAGRITFELESASASRTVTLSKALADVLAVRRRVAAFGRDERRRPIAALDRAIDRLRVVPTSSALRAQLCSEAARACGFERVHVSAVQDGAWTVIDAFSTRGVPTADALLAGIALDGSTPERRCIEEDRPVLAGPGDAPPSALAAEAIGPAYVVAPIAAPSGLIGLLHADHHPTDRPVDRLDSELLGRFAGSFADVFERASLGERLARQRRTIIEGLEREAREAERLAGTELTLGIRAPEPADPHGRGIDERRSNVTIDELLTARERDVVVLLVDGASNAMIAKRLVITVGTVKSHVKRILRKLGAKNRSEVISRYLELTAPD
ncbi:LuxR C-terminal-related transcriptional regulator [Patulibacter sp. NPDC049589]|uniref:helix-turn-helix transcriptional regulator n=1 Tax=Patulibacter sp. NPDC049589 TaxID=3154731 RepID=UPI00341A5383